MCSDLNWELVFYKENMMVAGSGKNNLCILLKLVFFLIKLLVHIYSLIATCQSLLFSANGFGRASDQENTGGTLLQSKWYYEITTVFFLGHIFE